MENKKYYCSICGHELKQYKEVSKDEKLYVCDKCNLDFLNTKENIYNITQEEKSKILNKTYTHLKHKNLFSTLKTIFMFSLIIILFITNIIFMIDYLNKTKINKKDIVIKNIRVVKKESNNYIYFNNKMKLKASNDIYNSVDVDSNVDVSYNNTNLNISNIKFNKDEINTNKKHKEKENNNKVNSNKKNKICSIFLMIWCFLIVLFIFFLIS